MAVSHSREPGFSIGIEEEFWLVDRESRDLATDPAAGFLKDCKDALGDQVSSEFMRCQVETGTKVCNSAAEARDQLTHMRSTVADIAARYDMALLAASTHPFAQWDSQKHTEGERYSTIARDLRTVVDRLLICGMHVHVGIEDDDLRIELMAQASYFLPHLLALTTSSPFWRGRDTGLQTFRLSVFDNLPRTGLPEVFGSWAEYRRHVDMLIQAGVIEDGTKLWWDLRPSDRWPTLEMRIADVCTDLEDAICVASITRCLMRMLYRLRRNNQRWRIYSNMLVRENRWRACRYGSDAGEKTGLIDFGRAEIVPYADLLEEIIELIRPDAEHFGCVAEVEHARTIIARGTSARRQREIYTDAVENGASPRDALLAVADNLIAHTVPGEKSAV
ncbi:carboxylate-amine ligase [Thalassospira permensis]|uniref:Putative glutamate--cysteine ligase 2 n=1 Tax=Thalassospira permensis NBRC 106175 TaxID=1353532 RepID=A0ABR4TLY6_9PROT|nr:carboxylate-amine ligase [Thalassospira permensis]KEO55081.1 carboxylate-amine ligase [Thalassospira permensis NBRC 106175]